MTAAALLARGGLEKTILQLVGDSLGRDDASRARAIVQRVFVIAGVTTAATGLAFALGSGSWLATALFSSEAMAAVSVLMGPWIIFLALEVLLAETFRAFGDIPRASLYGGALSRPLYATALYTVLVGRGSSSLQTIIFLAICCVATAVLGGGRALVGRLRMLEKPKESQATISLVVRTTMPLWVSNMTLFLTGHADLWILGAFRPEDEVALYAVAMRLVLLVGMSLTIVNAVLPPLIGELHAKGETTRMEQIIRTTASVAAIPSTVVLLAFIVAGKPMLSVAFGAFYRDAALVLAVLSMGQLVNVWVGSCGYTLIMTGRQRDLMWISLFASSMSVLGGLAVVVDFGAAGIAAAVTAGSITQQLLMLAVVRLRCGIWTHANPLLVIDPVRGVLRVLRARHAGVRGRDLLTVLRWPW